MRLHILSDLHLEFGPVNIPRTETEVVILAGDIDLGESGCLWARNRFPSRPIIYIMGNHEFYRHSIPALTKTLKRQTEGTNIHLLENNEVEIKGYTFLGCTLWTDFQLSGNPKAAMETAEGMVSDYRLIKFEPEKRPLRARDTQRMHRESVVWLRGALAKSDPARTIVVTHHSPSGRSESPRYANSPFKPAFSSDLDSLIEQSGVPLWIYGHTHYNTDYRIGTTRVLTNQRGYIHEDCPGFNPSLIVEV
jgi:predicted phosphodiesterase